MTRTITILSGIALAATLAAGAATPVAGADGKKLSAGAGGKKIPAFSELQGIRTEVEPIEKSTKGKALRSKKGK
jgi:hypothetical protein